MGKFGDFLLTRYADAPRTLWVILQLGAAVATWVAVRFMVSVTNTLAPLLELVWISVPFLQNMLMLAFFLGIHTAAHLLWKEMNQERQVRLLDLFVRTGKNLDAFKGDPEALTLRAAFLREQSGTHKRGRRKDKKRQH